MSTKFLMFFLLLGGLLGTATHLEQAKSSFEANDFASAIGHYMDALADYPDQAVGIRYNIGQCYLRIDSSDKASAMYQKAMDPKQPKIYSYAFNNTGIIQAQGQEKESKDKALEAFKEAMRKHPENHEARYNYELLKKIKMQEQEQQEQGEGENDDQEKKDQQDQQNQDQQNQDQEKKDQQDQQNQDQQDQNGEDQEGEEEESQEQEGQSDEQKDSQKEGDGKDYEPEPRDRENSGKEVEYREISIEQAQMLLEGMKENEKKFLQQLKKSPRAEKRRDGRPDW